MSGHSPVAKPTAVRWSSTRIALSIAGLVLFAIFLLIGVTVLEDRFGPIDPTDPGWKASVLNDLNAPIVVKDSGVNLTLEPGQSTIFASPGPGQLNFVLTVTDNQGRTLGCLVVHGDKQHTVTLKASQMTAC